MRIYLISIIKRYSNKQNTCVLLYSYENNGCMLHEKTWQTFNNKEKTVTEKAVSHVFSEPTHVFNCLICCTEVAQRFLKKHSKNATTKHDVFSKQ